MPALNYPETASFFSSGRPIAIFSALTFLLPSCLLNVLLPCLPEDGKRRGVFFRNYFPLVFRCNIDERIVILNDRSVARMPNGHQADILENIAPI